MDFATLWNAEAVAPSIEGTQFQTGANASYAFLEPMTVATPGAVPGTGGVSFNSGVTQEGTSATSSDGGGFFSGISNAVAGIGAAINPVAAIGAGTATASTGASSIVSQYFVRVVVIILGFIFVAAGLYMFKTNTTIIQR